MFVKRATVQSISKQFDLQRYISKRSKINSTLYSTSNKNLSKKAKKKFPRPTEGVLVVVAKLISIIVIVIVIVIITIIIITIVTVIILVHHAMKLNLDYRGVT